MQTGGFNGKFFFTIQPQFIEHGCRANLTLRNRTLL